MMSLPVCGGPGVGAIGGMGDLGGGWGDAGMPACGM